jgi:hypothetical protein
MILRRQLASDTGACLTPAVFDDEVDDLPDRGIGTPIMVNKPASRYALSR